MRFARLVAALIAGVSLAGSYAARADDYPSRPITLILPLGAGGAMDILARAQFEPKLKERLGKPIVIENRTGAGGVLGGSCAFAGADARRTPDDSRRRRDPAARDRPCSGSLRDGRGQRAGRGRVLYPIAPQRS